MLWTPANLRRKFPAKYSFETCAGKAWTRWHQNWVEELWFWVSALGTGTEPKGKCNPLKAVLNVETIIPLFYPIAIIVNDLAGMLSAENSCSCSKNNFVLHGIWTIWTFGHRRAEGLLSFVRVSNSLHWRSISVVVMSKKKNQGQVQPVAEWRRVSVGTSLRLRHVVPWFDRPPCSYEPDQVSTSIAALTEFEASALSAQV